MAKFNKKYLLKSTFRVALLSRLFAKAIDLFIVLILSFFMYPLGIILSAIYISICDSLQNGQSVGKKFMGFSVLSLEDGQPCTKKQSFIRNLPIFVPLVFAIIPIWGLIFTILLGTPLLAFEVYLLFKLDSGNRLGDVMADTTVNSTIESKVTMHKKRDSWFPTMDSSQIQRKKIPQTSLML